jgi:hypothetical protein
VKTSASPIFSATQWEGTTAKQRQEYARKLSAIRLKETEQGRAFGDCARGGKSTLEEVARGTSGELP